LRSSYKVWNITLDRALFFSAFYWKHEQYRYSRSKTLIISMK